LNSDDPAYFGGYVNDNFRAIINHLPITEDNIIQLARNSFEGSWLSVAEKTDCLDRLDDTIQALRAG